MIQRLKRALEYFGAALNGFRKWSVMMALITLGTIFLITNDLSGKEFVDLLTGTAIAFFAGNGLEHMTKATMAWVKGRNAK